MLHIIFRSKRLDVVSSEGQKAIEEMLDSDLLISDSEDIDDSFDDPDYVESKVCESKTKVYFF